MRFLADENIPLAIVEWLQASGHDVVYAGQIAAGEKDVNWLTRTEADQRLVITSDKDFGELIFREQLNSHGVILLRLGRLTIPERLIRLQQVWGVIEANPQGRFIVITEHRVRVRLLA